MTPRPAASCTVECLGLPGSGKSRLCAAAGAALCELGVETRLHLRHPEGIARRLLTAARVLGLLARRPGHCRRWLAHLRATRPASVGRLSWTWLKRSADAERHARQPAVHLTDAGIAQAMWALAFRARDEALEPTLSELAAEAVLPDLVLLLECRREVLQERLAARPAASGLPALLARDAAALDRGGELIDRLAAILSSLAPAGAGLRLVRLANDDEYDLTRNVDRLISLVGTTAA